MSEHEFEEPGDAVQRERHGSVLVASINRPSKGNSISHAVISALDELASDLEEETSEPDGPRALVLAGLGGKAFSAGADIHDLDGVSGSQARQQMQRGQRVFDRLEQLPMVVIAAISGYALGGGLELAMAADLRIADPDAKLGQPEISLANLPGWGGTQRLPRLVGLGRAVEMILTGDTIDANRAFEIGLVNQIAPNPLAAALDLATTVSARSPIAVKGAKRAIHAGLDCGMREGLSVEADAVAACCETAAQRAAVRTFLERKRRQA